MPMRAPSNPEEVAVPPTRSDRTDPALSIGVDIREWKRGTSTGIGRALSNFLGWAAEHRPARFVLVGNQDTEVRVVAEHFDVEIHYEPHVLFFDQYVLPRVLRRSGVDLFWSPYYKMPLRCPCPGVITIHDLIPWVVTDASGSAPRRGGPKQRWMRVLASRASRVLTCSEYSKRDMVETLDIAADKISIVPVGMDRLPGCRPEQEAIDRARARYGLPAAYVLYVGRFDTHKNVEMLAAAWGRLETGLRDRYPLVLAGSGRCRSVREGDGIILPGFIDDKDLDAVYAGARAFAFPSLYEGFGLPPLEAMASETPVVCSGAASLPEVVGDAAILIDPLHEPAWARALERVLTDEDLRQRLIERGKKRAALFVPERTAPLLMKLLTELATAA